MKRANSFKLWFFFAPLFLGGAHPAKMHTKKSLENWPNSNSLKTYNSQFRRKINHTYRRNSTGRRSRCRRLPSVSFSDSLKKAGIVN